MERTVVEVTCVSKKQSDNSWNQEHPIAHEIELSVPCDQNSVFWQMSGGTNMHLNTVNKEAADMFVIGEKYEMAISPVKEK